MDDTKRGIIKGIKGSGGIIRITFEDPATGEVAIVNGDNGPTVRALMGVFGTDIVRGMNLDSARIVGQEVGYDVDDLGILAYLEP